MATDTRALNFDERAAWEVFARAHDHVTAALDRELTAQHSLGLPDYEVLLRLAEASDRSLRMTELARSVMLSPSGLTRRLDGLVKQGYVERQPCPSDGRGLLAVLTDRGMEKVQEMSPTHVRGVRAHFVDCVPDDRLSMLIEIFEPIAKHEEDGSYCEPDADGRNQHASASGHASETDIRLIGSQTAGVS